MHIRLLIAPKEVLRGQHHSCWHKLLRACSCSCAAAVLLDGRRTPSSDKDHEKRSLLQHVTIYKFLPQPLPYHINPSEVGTRIPIVTHSDVSCRNDAAQPSSKQQSGGLGRT